jgi:hypothetical protein
VGGVGIPGTGCRSHRVGRTPPPGPPAIHRVSPSSGSTSRPPRPTPSCPGGCRRATARYPSTGWARPIAVRGSGQSVERHVPVASGSLAAVATVRGLALLGLCFLRLCRGGWLRSHPSVGFLLLPAEAGSGDGPLASCAGTSCPSSSPWSWSFSPSLPVWC